MWTDPIIEELHRQREAHAARFGFDPVAIGREFQRLQKEERDVTFVPPPEKTSTPRSSAA